MVVLPQVFHIPRVTDRGPVRVFDVVGPVMNDFADSVRSFPVWAEEDGALYLGILKHSPEYDAPDGKGSPFDLRVLVFFDLALLCGEASECFRSLLIDQIQLKAHGLVVVRFIERVDSERGYLGFDWHHGFDPICEGEWHLTSGISRGCSVSPQDEW